MTTIVHRVGNTRNLRPAEVDGNFDRLNEAVIALEAATQGLDGGDAESNNSEEGSINGGGA